MQINRADLADFAYFMEIARQQSFRKAAVAMGVSPSALSHAMRNLETRMGVRLLNRTTRSVTLTVAGEVLRDQISEPFEMIGHAAESLNRYRETPTGRIRINVLEDAATLILNPVIPSFVQRYPEVELDITVNNRLIDVIGEGFDAGIRYGGTVPEDMIAQKLTPEIRWVTAAAPSYLDRYGIPRHPNELSQHHACVQIRLGSGQVYDWEFDKDGVEIGVSCQGQITVNESHTAIAMGLNGVGIIYAAEPVIQPYLESGQLQLILEDWASMGSGYYLYYSSRHQVPTGLKLLLDLIRELQPLGPYSK